MSSGFWIGVFIVAFVYFGWLVWEVRNAPTMPDMYGLTDEEIKIKESIDNENKKKQTKKKTNKKK